MTNGEKFAKLLEKKYMEIGRWKTRSFFDVRNMVLLYACMELMAEKGISEDEMYEKAINILREV